MILIHLTIKKMKRIITYTFTFLVCLSVLAQPPRPADPQSEPIVVVNGMIHVGNGDVIENGFIQFDNGKIINVGEMSSNPDLSGFQQIDASGKHIYPGLIMPSIRVGLEDIGAVRPTRDYGEVNQITPNVRSQIAFNTDSEMHPTFRFNGILLAQVAPQGGIVTGTSSIMMLDGWNWEDATYQKDDGVHMNWPSKSFGPRWWLGETERRPNKQYDKQVSMISELIMDAKAYDNSTASEINLKLEAMKGVINGTQNLYVTVNRAGDIVEAVTKLKKYGVEKIVLVGARDAYYVRDLLKEHNIPVILDNVHRRPSRDDEDILLPFKLPGLLAKDGIKVSLRHSGMLSRGRNLPFYAGTAAAYGLDKEDALKMITSNTAEILGISDRAGTLENGKDANLLVCVGDILDMRSSIIESAFIQGREVEIEGKQQELYRRFRDKYSE